jgi:uncharacterized protein (DUF488 family)
MDLTIWTVGHSTHPFEEFLSVLGPCQIEAVADVRRYPGSRRQPHYHGPALRAAPGDQGIEYSWLPALGGRRTPSRQSINGGWRHPAFRGYADHLTTEEFGAGLAELIQLGRQYRTAMMCSEVLWWRCHRRLIADVLVSRGAQVVHILSAKKSEQHKLGPPARVIDGYLSYPEEKSGA